MVTETLPGTAAAFPFWFPDRLTAWKHDRVTLLGDAVHPMPPTAGLGASTAIVDAVNLAEGLTRAAEDVPDILSRYQADMLRYAPRAVAEARPPLFWQRRFKNGLIRRLGLSLALPAAGRAIALRHRLKNR
ncbi:FAD-dependent oxidoreductase [Saccharibacillus alkalitolerans]|uniref:FAD-binding domain-containing protein n=1 Tax=Saccharibacillus alkalitolerans TaxID=2705290 RepID=A0ABX0F1H9_9BACL|nr:FAD-dependent monooxygenase [Saccharibacillus alkalitolerans]NGZ74402.1 hypothetical protein [Saccharibacillus alkalitolerans]